MSHRARLAEVFVERKEHHKGIAATMPNGILGQDFAIQHLQVTPCVPVCSSDWAGEAIVEALQSDAHEQGRVIQDLWPLVVTASQYEGGGARAPGGRVAPSTQGYMRSLVGALIMREVDGLCRRVSLWTH